MGRDPRPSAHAVLLSCFIQNGHMGMNTEVLGIRLYPQNREPTLTLHWSYGLFPNLRIVCVNILYRFSDPFHQLYLPCLSKSVQTLQVNYTFLPRRPPSVYSYSEGMFTRKTPIKWPNTSHHIRTLIITGVKMVCVWQESGKASFLDYCCSS